MVILGSFSWEEKEELQACPSMILYLFRLSEVAKLINHRMMSISLTITGVSNACLERIIIEILLVCYNVMNVLWN